MIENLLRLKGKSQGHMEREKGEIHRLKEKLRKRASPPPTKEGDGGENLLRLQEKVRDTERRKNPQSRVPFSSPSVRGWSQRN